MGYIDEKGLERVLRTVKEYVDTSNKTVDWDDITNTPCHDMHDAVYIVSAYEIDTELAIGYDPIPLYIWNTNTGEVVQTGGDQIVEFNCTNGEVLKLQCLYQYYPDSDSKDWHILPIQPVYESTDEICFGRYNVKTLDEKYIPDTIARQKDLTELEEEKADKPFIFSAEKLGTPIYEKDEDGQGEFAYTKEQVETAFGMSTAEIYEELKTRDAVLDLGLKALPCTRYDTAMDGLIMFYYYWPTQGQGSAEFHLSFYVEPAEIAEGVEANLVIRSISVDEIPELREAIALRNIGATDTDESVEEPEIGGGGASTDKQGVIRQTQTWTQAADKGYDYVMSNLVRGAIPQANIDLFTSAGAIFNEESGYFELNGLTDISYEEMSAIYNAGYKMVEGYWSNNIRTNIFKSCNVYNADAAQLYGFVGMYANRNCKAESFKFTEQDTYGVSIKGNTYGTYDGCIYLKTFGKGVFFCHDTNISDQAFTKCYSLETIYLRNLKKNVWFKDSARLGNASILYMIKQSAATSPIVITLHADAKARAEADAEITAALEAHPNVSLASA